MGRCLKSEFDMPPMPGRRERERNMRFLERAARAADGVSTAGPTPAPDARLRGGRRRRKDTDRRDDTATAVDVAEARPACVEPRSTKRRGRAAVAREPGEIADLAELADQIHSSYEQFVGAFQTSVDHAVRVGRLVLRAKELLPHGTFKAWIEEHCPGIKERTARIYMQLARAVAEGRIDLEQLKRQPAADLSIKGILRQLAQPRARGGETAATSGSEERTAAAGAARSTRRRPSDDPSRPDRRERDDRRRDDDEEDDEEADDAAGSATEPRSRRADGGAGRGDAAGTHDPGEAPDDESWLATLPLRSQLADPSTFDEEARLWRRLQPTLDHLRRLHEPSPDESKAAWIGSWYRQRYAYLVAVPTGVRPPEQWALCSGCAGSGRSRSLEKECDTCRGAGYEVTHRGTPPPEQPGT